MKVSEPFQNISSQCGYTLAGTRPRMDKQLQQPPPNLPSVSLQYTTHSSQKPCHQVSVHCSHNPSAPLLVWTVLPTYMDVQDCPTDLLAVFIDLLVCLHGTVGFLHGIA